VAFNSPLALQQETPEAGRDKGNEADPLDSSNC
jgi:hypothetical protein